MYKVSDAGEFGRDSALRNQIRHAVISIASNIAEGFERDGDKEFLQYLYIAKGSCGEVRTQLYLAVDNNYLTEETLFELKLRAVELNRIISGFQIPEAVESDG